MTKAKQTSERKIEGAVRVRVFVDQTQRIAVHHKKRTDALSPMDLKSYNYSDTVREVLDAGLEVLGYSREEAA